MYDQHFSFSLSLPCSLLSSLCFLCFIQRFGWCCWWQMKMEVLSLPLDSIIVIKINIKYTWDRDAKPCTNLFAPFIMKKKTYFCVLFLWIFFLQNSESCIFAKRLVLIVRWGFIVRACHSHCGWLVISAQFMNNIILMGIWVLNTIIFGS